MFRSTIMLVLSAVVASAAVLAPMPESRAAAATPTQKATYRVDCSSGSAGDGLATPWNSVAAVSAHGAFLPGDRILLKRGTTCRGVIKPSGSGRADAPIVLGAYGVGAKPTVEGSGGNYSGAVTLENLQYWTIQDLHVTNHGRSLRTTHRFRSGVRLVNNGVGRLRGVVLQRLNVEEVVSTNVFGAEDNRNWGGIAAITYRGPVPASGFSGLVIRNNRVSKSGRTGIVVTNRSWPIGFDDGVRITGNTVRRARGDSIVVRGLRNSRIDNNLSADGADLWPCPECSAVSDSWHASVAIWTAQSRGVRIDHNEVYGMRAKGGDGEAFDADVDTKNTVIEYNYAHDNAGGGVLFCGSINAVVRFNVFQNNQKSVFAFIGNFPATNSKIYNNTVYQSKRSRGGIARYFNGAAGKGIKFYNNIVYSFGAGTYHWPTAVQSRSNTYIGTHRAGEPGGGASRRSDAGLAKPGSGKRGMASLKGYRPTSKKKLARGVAIPSTVQRDFFGKRIDPRRPPRGAAG